MEDINNVEEVKDTKGRRKSVTKEELEEILDANKQEINDMLKDEFNTMEIRLYKGIAHQIFKLMDRVDILLERSKK